MTEVEEQTKFKFAELSDKAKNTAREAHRYHYVEYEWWDGIYEDAVRMGSILGIEISTTPQRTGSGKSYETTDIFFSGFSSQGDGACFTGYYAPRFDALEKLAAETDDEELTRIATELFTIQLTRRLQGLDLVRADISQSGNYCHSYTMNVALVFGDSDEFEFDEVGLEVEINQLMRDFADWIYKNLETEHDYLTSDEYIDEALADDLFDEDGTVL